MTAVNHEQLQRSLGRVEATQDGFKERMDRLEGKVDDGFKSIESGLAKIDHRLAAIEARENERKGAWKTIVMVAGAVSAAVAAAIKYLFT